MNRTILKCKNIIFLFIVHLPQECGTVTKVTAGSYHSAALTGSMILNKASFYFSFLKAIETLVGT
jgi:hypothetical protein